ncbi:Mut7-C RNAse domain-containing protein [Natronomonas halophila]|uniref:Mut7-C RNAse domain-containing protein n=1 Tax=Natronomonas halophila TaxID=2747817 RepID=UPI0015B5F3A6|nr:Mut7-C RNAse domain-containing protein [Natronomonas halophila]QLD86383.1 Mut7-C RNAse domain-containing protein [Natronomonas halophila]
MTTEKEPDENDTTSVRPETDAFVLDVMLGKLAVHLRLAGYDTAYAGDRDIEADDRILELADAEDRILLTRDVELAERADDSILLTKRDVESQLVELREAGVKLEADEEPSRCGRCNGRLDAVPEDADTPEYAPDPADTDCWCCRDCGQVFWKGSHYERMKKALD